MISRIYKITNDINNKIYIGKTCLTIEERFKQHLKDAKSNYKNRPLYDAILKYGKEHFKIELIEECNLSVENEREKYWIEFYNSYKNGYNATKGGEGICLYDYDIIAELIKQNKTTKEITNIIGCCPDVVWKVARLYNLKIYSSSPVLKDAVPVHQYSKNNEYIQSFNSYADAARWLKSNKYTNGNLTGIRSHINHVCQGKRKTAYGFIWKNS